MIMNKWNLSGVALEKLHLKNQEKTNHEMSGVLFGD